MDLKKSDSYLAAAALAVVIVIYFFKYLDPKVTVNASDVLTQQYFWELFSRERLHASPSFTTWLPYVNGGIPFGGGLEKLFRPLGFLYYYIFPPNFAMSLDVILHFWLMAFGTYLYTKRIGLSLPAALLSALFFALSAEQVTLMNAGHLGKINTIAWTPLIFWAVERGIAGKRSFDYIIAGFLLSAQLFEGHIQISFYVCLAVGLYFIGRTVPPLFRKETSLSETGRLYLNGLVMVVVFLLLSAFTLTQWFEFKGQSERGEGTSWEFATSWSMPPEELATYVVPDLFGLSRANYYNPDRIDTYYWGRMPFTQTNDYLGLLPLVLLTVALLRKRNRYVAIFGFMAVLFLILAMGKHTSIYRLFYEYAGFKFFRVPKMNLFLVSFAVSVIAGFGAQRLLEYDREKDRPFYRGLLWGAGGAAFILFGVYLIGLTNARFWMSSLGDALSGSGMTFSRDPSVLTGRYKNALEGVLIAGVILGAITVWLSLAAGRVGKSRLFFAGLTVIFLIDITLVNRQFMDVIPIEGSIYTDRNAAISFFQKNPGRYRVLNATDHPASYNVHNKFLMYNIESATGYEAVGIAAYTDLLNVLRLDGRLLDLMNIRYVIMGKNRVAGTVGQQLGKFTIVLDEDVKVLENNHVLPRAFPVHRARSVKDKKMIVSALTSPSFDPAEVVLLEDAVPETMPEHPEPHTASRVRIASYRNDEIIVEAEMADNGFVVMSDKYYPGWKATLDGVPAKIYRADHAFRAVYVPGGDHRIAFSYEPVAYKRGLYITLITFLTIISVLIMQWMKRRKDSALSG